MVEIEESYLRCKVKDKKVHLSFVTNWKKNGLW